MKEGLAGDNFYVRTHAAVALSGLAQVRRVGSGKEFRLSHALREQIHTLTLTTLNEHGNHIYVLNSLTKVLQWLSELSEEEATQIQQITSVVSSEQSLREVVAFDFSLALGKVKVNASFNSEPFRDRLVGMLVVPGDRQRIGVWILSKWLESGECSVKEARFIIDPLVRAPQNSRSTFFFYELVKVILKSDLAYGRECLEAVLESEHAQPRDGYDQASYQLAEILRQVAASDLTAASLIAAQIKSKFGDTRQGRLLFLQQYLSS